MLLQLITLRALLLLALRLLVGCHLTVWQQVWLVANVPCRFS